MQQTIMDKETFTRQVIQNQEALFRTARSILRQDQDAEDAVQEAICSAFAHRAMLRDPAKFKPWILRIVANQCYEQCRRRKPTVDLADVDLWTGNVYSEKLGACASWVVRGSHMKKIEGASLPLGILEEASATSTQYRLHSGDILVMVSDGVADAFETDEQFSQALTESLYIQPQRMADALLRNALLAGGGAPRDDMSVMVLLLLDRQQGKG